MTLFCKYANVAGVPGTGVHKARFLGMAAFDLFGTILIALVITFLLVRFTSLKSSWVLVMLYMSVTLLALSVFMHWLFCVPTFTNKVLGLV